MARRAIHLPYVCGKDLSSSPTNHSNDDQDTLYQSNLIKQTLHTPGSFNSSYDHILILKVPNLTALLSDTPPSLAPFEKLPNRRKDIPVKIGRHS